MAAPVYSTDLVTIDSADTGRTGWVEPTGSTAGGAPGQELDYFIQGTACVTKTFNTTGDGGAGFTAAAGVTIPSNGAVYVWRKFTAPNAINTKANGGMQILIGSSSANYYRFYVDGRDTYTYGGWICYPVDPSVTASATQGTPTGTRQFFGGANNVTNAIQRGYPLAVDAMRYGRGTLQVVNGDLANGYGTFLGAATFNDYNDVTNGYNRFGILSLQGGTYKFQGHLLMGTAGTAVDFRDSNRTIIIQNTEFVQSGFNLFEVRNASSNVSWDGISILALGTVSRGNFTVTDNATVTKDNCTFTDMGDFTYKSNSTITDSTFRRCGLITQSAATFTNCVFDQPRGTTGILVAAPADLSEITDSTFISDGTGHAIEITGTAANCTLSGNIFSGYAASNGSTGNEAIYVNIATGSMTINITNGGNTPSIRTAGATVTVTNSKTFTVTNITANTELRIYRQSDMVELAGAEIVGSSPSGVSNLTIASDPDNAGRYTAEYSYEYTTDTPIYVVAHSLAYQWLRQSAVLKSTSSSLQIVQLIDRQYENP